jgi:lysozyme
MKRLMTLALLLALFQSCERETIRMEGFKVHGIDVSHHQEQIEWDSVAQQAVTFAFVKATEGSTHRDGLFSTNWKEMKRVGILRGAYHFFRPQTPAEEQAMNFIELVDMEFGDLPPVLDVEVLDGSDKIHLITQMRTWLYMIELHYDIRPIIYTNLKFYNEHLAGHFDEYPLWIARYSYRRPDLEDQKDWKFWQYGNRGRLAGIDGPVDFNVFYGNKFQLKDMALRPRQVLSMNQ